MEKGLLEKTGKPLAYWIEVVKKTGIEKHGEILKHLKIEDCLSKYLIGF